ncbi:MAG: hypothetical protein OEV55_05720 [candidate division Zixibacteria bacterium]|nr:hypothetical protein [candidate division Zixibacteria bacterium]
MARKETTLYEKTLFADFIRELLNRRNLSFRRVAKIGQDLGFEVSASNIYKSIHNSKKSPLKPEYINMFATIFNLDERKIVEKVLEDKYCDYFFEDIITPEQLLKQVLQHSQAGRTEEAKFLLKKYIEFLRDFKEADNWQRIEYDLNMKFASSLKDQGRYLSALDQCFVLLNSGGYSVEEKNQTKLKEMIDILHLITCLLYRLNRKVEFEIFCNAGLHLAQYRLKDLFQRLRFEAVKANFLHDNRMYKDCIHVNTQIVKSLKKYLPGLKTGDGSLYRKCLCNLASALTNLGWVLAETSREKYGILKGLKYIQEGYATIQRTDHQKLTAHILFYFARTNLILKEYAKASELFLKSKSIAEKEGFLDLITFNHWGLGMACLARNDKKSAEQYFHLAKSEIQNLEEDTVDKREVEEFLMLRMRNKKK